MAYHGVLAAVRARLEGQDPSYVPALGDLPKQWDHTQPDRLIGINRDAHVDTEIRPNAYTDVGQRQVPIFYFDYSGHEINQVYPSLTFEVIDTPPRIDESYIHSDMKQIGDYYQIPVLSSQENITMDGVDLGKSVRQISKRPVEHPLDIVFEVRAYSDDPIESALLVSYVYQCFGVRGFLRVPMKDGSYRSWDMLFKDYKDLDKRDAVRSGSPGTKREYCKVWTYLVEGYFDNTDLSKLANLIRSRTIGFSKAQPDAALGVFSPAVPSPDGSLPPVPVPPPTLTYVSPASGLQAGNTLITLKGANYQPGVTVRIVGGALCTAVTVSADGSTLTARTPAHAAGLVSIKVTNPDSPFITLAAAFTYV